MAANNDPEVTQPTVSPNIKVLANGSHYDLTRGRLVKGPSREHYLTPERGRQLQPLAIEARYRRGRRGMVAAAEEHTGKTGLKSLDAYEALTYEFTASALANAADKPRDAVAAAKLVLRMADMSPADQQQQPAADGLAVTGAGIDFLRELLQRAAPQVIHVVEGEAHELED